LTFSLKFDLIDEVMKERMNIYYRPAKHNGVKNHENYMHTYCIELDESFENRSNGEKFAGIGGKCVETGEYKRFRMDRLAGMYPVSLSDYNQI
jgi:hypothetical protein